MFAFFQGTKFVIIMITIIAIPLGILTYYVWPIIAGVLQSITHLITTSGYFGTWLFGFIDKALLPFGIHHLIAFPIEYSAVGGTMTIDGTVYEGVRNIIVGQAGSASATGYIVRNFTTGRILFQLAGLPGAAFAMYKCAKVENRKKVASLLIPAVLTLALVGISEPIEYTFLFASPVLYWLVYAPLCGLCYVLTELTKVSINGNALFFMIPNLFQPNKVHIFSLLYLLPLTFVTYYAAFKFMIEKFNIKTPGRGDDDIKLMSKKEYQQIKNGIINNDSLEARIVEAFGGADNIDSVTCCATRLRVSVKDETKVGTEEQWKAEGAMGLVMKGQGVQAIYGPKADVLKSDIQDLLDSGEVIPETLPSQKTAAQQAEVAFKGVTEEVHSVAEGQVIELEKVQDPVFSQKMMGDGFAVEPANGQIVSPVAGKVTSVFPTKHALGLVTESGLEVLVHIGLDTVSLEGKPFTVKVEEGQTVAAGDLLVEADLDAIREAGRATTTVVVFTNGAAIQSVTLTQTGQLPADAVVAKVEL